jgi:ectoine hydroxylase-related dioxygenase (phytanoyl-CoA dioxygenase family)
VHYTTPLEITSQVNLLGYSIEQEIFSQSECDHLLEALSSSLGKRSRAGARHLMGHPAIAAIAFDQRLLDIAQHSLDGAAMPYRATLFEKSIHAKWFVVWHQDRALPLEAGFASPEWGPWSRKAGITYAHAPAWALSRIIALRIHLDPSSGDNGPLKVIPGSHRAGVMSEEEVLNYAGAGQAVECHVDRGGVLAMSPLLIHSSSKARSNKPRRVLHIEYTRALQLSPTIRLAVA